MFMVCSQDNLLESHNYFAYPQCSESLAWGDHPCIYTCASFGNHGICTNVVYFYSMDIILSWQKQQQYPIPVLRWPANLKEWTAKISNLEGIATTLSV